MSRLGATLQRAAEWLRPRRDDVLGDWVRAVADLRGVPEAEAREGCARDLYALLGRLAQGDADAVVAEEALRAERETRRGASLLGAALDMITVEALAMRFLSKHVLFVFDSCFAGSVFEVMREGEQPPPDIKYTVSLPVRQFIAAGTAEESVPDNSLFREYFVEALSGPAADAFPNGYLTGRELGGFLTRNVIRVLEARAAPAVRGCWLYPMAREAEECPV